MQTFSDQKSFPETFLAERNYTLRSANVTAMVSVVCRLSSVTLVHPTQTVKLFGNILHDFVH